MAWSPPLDECYKVNIDGSHSNMGGSACGGFVRKSNGSFVHGFYCMLGSRNALWFEFWGMHLGIKLARQIVLSWVIFEFDSKVVVDMINSWGSHLAYLNTLTKEIISLLRNPIWGTSIVHTYKEGNRGADFLHRKGFLF